MLLLKKLILGLIFIVIMGINGASAQDVNSDQYSRNMFIFYPIFSAEMWGIPDDVLKEDRERSVEIKDVVSEVLLNNQDPSIADEYSKTGFSFYYGYRSYLDAAINNENYDFVREYTQPHNFVQISHTNRFIDDWLNKIFSVNHWQILYSDFTNSLNVAELIFEKHRNKRKTALIYVLSSYNYYPITDSFYNQLELDLNGKPVFTHQFKDKMDDVKIYLVTYRLNEREFAGDNSYNGIVDSTVPIDTSIELQRLNNRELDSIKKFAEQIVKNGGIVTSANNKDELREVIGKFKADFYSNQYDNGFKSSLKSGVDNNLLKFSPLQIGNMVSVNNNEFHSLVQPQGRGANADEVKEPDAPAPTQTKEDTRPPQQLTPINRDNSDIRNVGGEIYRAGEDFIQSASDEQFLSLPDQDGDGTCNNYITHSDEADSRVFEAKEFRIDEIGEYEIDFKFTQSIPHMFIYCDEFVVYEQSKKLMKSITKPYMIEFEINKNQNQRIYFPKRGTYFLVVATNSQFEYWGRDSVVSIYKVAPSDNAPSIAPPTPQPAQPQPQDPPSVSSPPVPASPSEPVESIAFDNNLNSNEIYLIKNLAGDFPMVAWPGHTILDREAYLYAMFQSREYEGGEAKWYIKPHRDGGFNIVSNLYDECLTYSNYKLDGYIIEQTINANGIIGRGFYLSPCVTEDQRQIFFISKNNDETFKIYRKGDGGAFLGLSYENLQVGSYVTVQPELENAYQLVSWRFISKGTRENQDGDEGPTNVQGRGPAQPQPGARTGGVGEGSGLSEIPGIRPDGENNEGEKPTDSDDKNGGTGADIDVDDIDQSKIDILKDPKVDKLEPYKFYKIRNAKTDLTMVAWAGDELLEKESQVYAMLQSPDYDESEADWFVSEVSTGVYNIVNYFRGMYSCLTFSNYRLDSVIDEVNIFPSGQTGRGFYLSNCDEKSDLQKFSFTKLENGNFRISSIFNNFLYFGLNEDNLDPGKYITLQPGDGDDPLLTQWEFINSGKNVDLKDFTDDVKQASEELLQFDEDKEYFIVNSRNKLPVTLFANQITFSTSGDEKKGLYYTRELSKWKIKRATLNKNLFIIQKANPLVKNRNELACLYPLNRGLDIKKGTERAFAYPNSGSYFSAISCSNPNIFSLAYEITQNEDGSYRIKTPDTINNNGNKLDRPDLYLSGVTGYLKIDSHVMMDILDEDYDGQKWNINLASGRAPDGGEPDGDGWRSMDPESELKKQLILDNLDGISDEDNGLIVKDKEEETRADEVDDQSSENVDEAIEIIDLSADAFENQLPERLAAFKALISDRYPAGKDMIEKMFNGANNGEENKFNQVAFWDSKVKVCWKELSNRGEGVAPTICPTDYKIEGDKCVKDCSEGFEVKDGKCKKICPAGFEDTGLGCGKPDNYEVNIKVWSLAEAPLKKVIEECKRANGGVECERTGIIISPKSRSGILANFI